MRLHRSSFQQLLWPAEKVNLKKIPQNVGGRAWNLSTPIGRSKTPPRPLREALRIRMGGKGGKRPGGLFEQPARVLIVVPRLVGQPEANRG
jgi:hypothetical protein